MRPDRSAPKLVRPFAGPSDLDHAVTPSERAPPLTRLDQCVPESPRSDSELRAVHRGAVGPSRVRLRDRCDPRHHLLSAPTSIPCAVALAVVKALLPTSNRFETWCVAPWLVPSERNRWHWSSMENPSIRAKDRLLRRERLRLLAARHPCPLIERQRVVALLLSESQLALPWLAEAVRMT